METLLRARNSVKHSVDRTAYISQPERWLQFPPNSKRCSKRRKVKQTAGGGTGNQVQACLTSALGPSCYREMAIFPFGSLSLQGKEVSQETAFVKT